jgi:hypothetical protein
VAPTVAGGALGEVDSCVLQCMTTRDGPPMRVVEVVEAGTEQRTKFIDRRIDVSAAGRQYVTVSTAPQRNWSDTARTGLADLVTCLFVNPHNDAAVSMDISSMKTDPCNIPGRIT